MFKKVIFTHIYHRIIKGNGSILPYFALENKNGLFVFNHLFIKVWGIMGSLKICSNFMGGTGLLFEIIEKIR